MAISVGDEAPFCCRTIHYVEFFLVMSGLCVKSCQSDRTECPGLE